MEFEDPKTVMEKVAKAEMAKDAKWYRSLWFRIVRIPVAFGVVLTIIVCCTVQPSGTDEVQVKLEADPKKLEQETREFTEDIETRYYQAVSYTHLTLPTILLV